MEGAEEVRMGVAREEESEEAFFVTVAAAALSHLVRIYSLRVVRLVAVLVDQPSRPLAMHHLKWALIPVVAPAESLVGSKKVRQLVMIITMRREERS